VEKYKIPYTYEVSELLKKNHDVSGHISFRRVYNSIKAKKFYWKSMHNDIINYIVNCSVCIKNKGGITIKARPKIIKT
jgi:hypothetical protein